MQQNVRNCYCPSILSHIFLVPCVDYIMIKYLMILYLVVDKCATNNGGCSQICLNNECKCKDGYVLADDKKTCKGKNCENILNRNLTPCQPCLRRWWQGGCVGVVGQINANHERLSI